MPIGQPLGAVWEYDASATAYVDNTSEAALAGGTNFELLGATGDYTYFGFNRRHDALAFVAGTVGVYGTLTWEYGASITSWIRFIPVYDDDFETATGYMQWDIKGTTLETDWVSITLTTTSPHVVSSVPDSISRFYIRVSSPASVNTAAAITSVVCRPYVTYGTALDVQRQLQLRNGFSTSSTPTISTIEDFIRSAEDRMIYDMGESWRLEFIAEEFLNFKQYGMKTRYQPIIEMYELAVFEGNTTFTAKTVGRSQDYHFEPRTGMVYLSTIFLDALPPTFRRSYTARREQGAFKRPVRVRYSHGHDIRIHPLGQAVGRIAIKQACIDFITDQDFAPLVPLGIDTVGLAEKVDIWQQQVQEFLDKFTKIKVF